MAIIFELLFAFMFLYAIYQLGSLAGVFSERAGVANIAIEGNMIIGATLFAVFWNIMPESIANIPQLSLFICIMIAVGFSILYMSLLTLFTNRFYADHIIVGTGLNLFAPAIAIMIWLAVIVFPENVQMSGEFNHWMYEYNASTSLNTLAIWMSAIALAIAFVAWYFINKTKYGLRIKSSGENPYALETSGISVRKVRRFALIIAGALSGLAGVVFVIKNPTFNFTVLGSGFISIAILIMAGHRVKGTVIYSVIFAASISIFDSWLVIAPGSSISSDLMMMLPFAIPIVGLLIYRKRTIPKAVGQNFRKDQR